MTTPSIVAPRPSRGRLLLLLGLALPVLGVAGYVAQVAAQRLTAPWYMPALATLGVVCVVASLWRRRTVWRVLAVLFVVVLAGFEWTVLLHARLPEYTGPLTAGQPFPAFTTARADGTPFPPRD